MSRKNTIIMVLLLLAATFVPVASLTSSANTYGTYACEVVRIWEDWVPGAGFYEFFGDVATFILDPSKTLIEKIDLLEDYSPEDIKDLIHYGLFFELSSEESGIVEPFAGHPNAIFLRDELSAVGKLDEHPPGSWEIYRDSDRIYYILIPKSLLMHWKLELNPILADLHTIAYPLCRSEEAPSTVTSPTNAPATESEPTIQNDIEIVSVVFPSVVIPGELVQPSITIRVISGSLGSSNSSGDHLNLISENFPSGIWPVQPIHRQINAGETYTFDINNDPSFQFIAPNTQGTYELVWQLRVDGEHIGPQIVIPFTVGQVNPGPIYPSWLAEFSIADKPPLEIDIHVRVNWTVDFGSFRVCIDGMDCRESSSTEVFFKFNSFGWEDGNHTLSIQYRRLSDGSNWDNALRYEEQIYFSPIRAGTAPCDGGEGAYLRSGSDCIRLTESYRDVSLIGWSDRDLRIEVIGPYDAWAYDSVDYEGTVHVVKSGEDKPVGNNVSSVKLEAAASAPPHLPASPFTCDSHTVALYHFDEASGNTVTDACGNLHGSKESEVSWVAGRFDTALSFSNRRDGRGVYLGAPAAFDVCPMTVEFWLRLPPGSGGGRVAGQQGGGGNTGRNKWLVSIQGGKLVLEIWSEHGSHSAYSSKNISDDAWHLVMFTYDCGNTGKLYLDNELVGTVITDSVWPSGTTTLEIGATEGIGRLFGEIDEFRISNTVRVPQSPSTPTQEPTVTLTSTASATPTVTASHTATPIPPSPTSTLEPTTLPTATSTTQSSQSTEADLIIESITISNTNPAPRERITITTCVINQGGEEARWSYLGYYTDREQPPTPNDSRDARDFVGSLDSQEVSCERWRKRFNTAGTYPIYIVVDYSQRVAESNEENNVSVIYIQVGDAATSAPPTFTAEPTFTATATPTDVVILPTETPVPTATLVNPSPTPTEAAASSTEPPGMPTLLSPTDGGTAERLLETFDWTDVAAANSYQIQVATSWTFRSSSIVVDVSTSGSEYTLTQALAVDDKYRWRIRAINEAGYSEWTDEWKFRAPAPPPNLSSPGNGSILTSLRPTFSWTEVTDARRYQIQISTDSDFANLLLEDDVRHLDFTPDDDLPPGTTIYWRMRSRGFFGDFVGWWSPTWAFTTP